MAEEVKKPTKKADVVPKTELSSSEDKATRRFIGIMISVIVITVLVGGSGLYWLVNRYIYQTNKNKAQDQTIVLLQQKKVNLEQLRPNYEKITTKGSSGKSDADLILNAMPVDEGFRELIAMLERMGQESGVRLISIDKAASSSGSAAISSGAKSYDVTVNMEGPFSKILDFLRKTEKSSRVLDFVSMNTSSSPTGAGANATATFRAYYQAPADIKPTERELQ